MPVSSSTSPTTCARSPRTSWHSDTLTAIRLDGRPASRHARTWFDAVRSTQLPMPTMSPASSARGTNSDGGTEPSSAESQRSSASAAEIRLEGPSTRGW
jgi:hypothetical protein